MIENKLVSPYKQQILVKEKNLVSDYVDMYLNKTDANQMLVFGELAKKYNYSMASILETINAIRTPKIPMNANENRRLDSSAM